MRWAPLGSTWYDALQLNLTQRQWHGLSSTAAFTWQHERALGSGGNPSAGGGPTNNVFDREAQKGLAANSQPYIFVTSFNYITPRPEGKWLGALLGDWTVAGLLRYASGQLIPVPGAQNNLFSLVFQNTRMNRVEGQPLFLEDPNCHCIDPRKDFVLNPAAWSDPAPGQFGTSKAFYDDYRWQTQVTENLSVGRRFVLKGQTFCRGPRGVLQRAQPDLSADADRLQQQSALDANVQFERRAHGRLRLHQPDGDARRASAERPGRRAVPVLTCASRIIRGASPPEPLTGSLAGAPTPRSARQALSLPLFTLFGRASSPQPSESSSRKLTRFLRPPDSGLYPRSFCASGSRPRPRGSGSRLLSVHWNEGK